MVFPFRVGFMVCLFAGGCYIMMFCFHSKLRGLCVVVFADLRVLVCVAGMLVFILVLGVLWFFVFLEATCAVDFVCRM